MKIVHIIPGSGGTFYCQNCMRDNEMILTLRRLGHDILMVPMYLPLNVGGKGMMGDTPVFYGAINVYLKEKLPIYRHAPKWLERIFDSQSLLQMAAKKAGSTRASGLEEMTISMLQGEHGRQASELDHLIRYLKTDIKPDIVHLSNALLLGLARRLKNDLGTKVVCSLQDENEWIDPMHSEFKDVVWGKMTERARDVDAFIAASEYFAERSIKQMQLPKGKVYVVYGGIDLSRYQQSSLPFNPPIIGYLCRMTEYFGLGIMVDAFIQLKKTTKFNNTKLFLTGGYTADDQPFVHKMQKKLADNDLTDDVTFFEDFDVEPRIEFLKSLTLLSVPVPGGEAFGAYQVEALAAGVPIVQPNIGGYPEFIEATGGGILYEPNTPEKLAEAWVSLLENPEKLQNMGNTGLKSVREKYSMEQMANNIIDVYQSLG